MKNLKIKGRVFRNLATTSFVVLLGLVTFVLNPISIEFENAEAVVASFESNIITFDSINNVASVSLKVSSPDGSFATSDEDQKASFAISTNNYTGYTLMIRSNNESMDLIDGDNKLSSISEAVSYDDFSGVSRVSKALNNKWGYLPNYYRDGDTNVVNEGMYLPSPTSDATVLRVTESANSENGVDNADIYTIGLGVRADYTNPEGVYTFGNNGEGATFVIEYVANPLNYIMNYIDNTDDDTVDGMPGTQAGNTDNDSVEISREVPVRLGYEFAGWCTVEPVIENGAAVCNDKDEVAGAVYLPGDLYNIDQTLINNINLYALWNVRDANVDAGFDETEEEEETTLLYDAIVALVKEGEELSSQDEEVAPGVYIYNDNVDAVDENDEYDEYANIYYYYGVFGDYIEDEDEIDSDENEEIDSAEVYPNYVKMADDENEAYTCWKIVRTTKTGGIRLVYNGIYGATTAESCVNTTENAQIITNEDSVAFGNEDGLENLDLATFLTDSEKMLIGVDDILGIRPVVVLDHSAAIVSGLGTETDPWVIDR